MRDTEVIKCNTLIRDWSKHQTDVFLAIHSNLRDPGWSMFRDAKHITKDAIPRFASNIKRALRSAYGINLRQQRNTNYPR